MQETRKLPFPVLVLPTFLTFFSAVRKTHKQILTLYNPLDTPISFEVKTNIKNRYYVGNDQGVLAPSHCIEIVVTHLQPTLQSHKQDKLRISIRGPGKLCDHRDIPLYLSDGEPNEAEQDDEFVSLGHAKQAATFRDGEAPSQQAIKPLNDTPHGDLKNVIGLFCLGLILVLVFIYAPVVGKEESPFLPQIFHIPEQLKYFIAYFLGLISYTLVSQIITWN